MFIIKNKAESLACAGFCTRSSFGWEPFIVERVASATCCRVFKERLHKTAAELQKRNAHVQSSRLCVDPETLEIAEIYWRPSVRRCFPDFFWSYLTSSLFTDYTAKRYFLHLKLVHCLSVIIHDLHTLTPARKSIMLLFLLDCSPENSSFNCCWYSAYYINFQDRK